MMKQINKVKRLSLVILFVFSVISSIAQDESFHEPPSLQIGLGGLDITKGVLDSELVLEIIADKQMEVKNQLMQNMLLGKIDGAGGAVYAYVDNLLNILMHENNSEVQVKKALESSVNLAFVYAFANYYIYTMDNNEFADINKMAMSLGCYLPTDYKDRKNPKTLHELVNDYYQTQFDSKTTFNESNNLKVNALLIDIAAEVVNNNKALKTLGLIGGVNSDSYLYNNRYLNLTDCPAGFIQTTFLRKYSENTKYLDTMNVINQEITALEGKLTKDNNANKKFEKQIQNKDSRIDQLKKNMNKNGVLISKYSKCYADNIYNDMNESLNTLVSNIGFVWYLNDLVKNVDFNEIDIHMLDSLLFPESDLDTLEFSELVTISKKQLATVLDSVEMNSPQHDVVTETIKYLNRLQNVDLVNNKLNVNSDILYHLSKEIIPKFIELLSSSSDIIEINDLLEQMVKMLAKQLLSEKNNLEFFNQNQVFFTMIGKLYEFHEASTYTDYLNVLSDIGDIFPNHRIQTAINTTVSLLKDYITFSENEDTITVQFDVESCLIKLSNMKYNRYQPFKLLFTVGANTLNFDVGVELDGEELKSYSFVGEKIGLKYVFWDWDYTHTFHKGETFQYYGNTYTRNIPAKTPMVSNIHLIVYGSGLLYNLANTGTTNDFNSPILGVGPGITFFNNLDLNATIGIPLIDGNSFGENFKHVYYCIGFDIQFTEYYNKLREKQQSKKKQKQLLELHKNGN